MSKRWIILILILAFACIAVLCFMWHVANESAKQECIENGGRVVKVRGGRAAGEWICDE